MRVVFTKLAAQLNADKLAELAVIPVIFVVQTLVSYLVSVAVSKGFGFGKRPANFVTAMGVSVFVPREGKYSNSLGVWELELPPDLARHFPITDLERIALGQDTWR